MQLGAPVPELWSPTVAVVELTPEQLGVLAEWSAVGAGFAPIVVHGARPTYAEAWDRGDILAVQGDDHVQISARGVVLEAVPPIGPEAGRGTPAI